MKLLIDKTTGCIVAFTSDDSTVNEKYDSRPAYISDDVYKTLVKYVQEKANTGKTKKETDITPIAMLEEVLYGRPYSEIKTMYENTRVDNQMKNITEYLVSKNTKEGFIASDKVSALELCAVITVKTNGGPLRNKTAGHNFYKRVKETIINAQSHYNNVIIKDRSPGVYNFGSLSKEFAVPVYFDIYPTLVVGSSGIATYMVPTKEYIEECLKNVVETEFAKVSNMSICISKAKCVSLIDGIREVGEYDFGVLDDTYGTHSILDDMNHGEKFSYHSQFEIKLK